MKKNIWQSIEGNNKYLFVCFILLITFFVFIPPLVYPSHKHPPLVNMIFYLRRPVFNEEKNIIQNFKEYNLFGFYCFGLRILINGENFPIIIY